MIKLTLTDNSEILINTDQISKVESTEPTTVILKGGKNIEVMETVMTIMNLIKALSYRDINTLQ